jgi:hypothetical protein
MGGNAGKSRFEMLDSGCIMDKSLKEFRNFAS